MEEAPLHVIDAEISARVCGPEMEEAPFHVIDAERARRYIFGSQPATSKSGRQASINHFTIS